MGGVAMIIGLISSGLAAGILLEGDLGFFISFLGAVLMAGVIGAIDDLKTLNARVKPLLTTLTGLPILLMGSYRPSIIFPIIGGTRLTKVYPLLIPIVMAVTSNATNMMDPFNGVMASSCSIVTLVLLVSSHITGSGEGVLLCSSLLGVLLAFYYYNRFPSKVFSGDVGSLSVGAALGAIAILGHLEVVAVVAFMPQIMNSFYGLSTVGRLYERREVARPIEVMDDGRLRARSDPEAPLTLARFVLARSPLRENEAVMAFMILSVIAGILALATTYLILLTT